jgi:H+/Cl- antiporter ClcA
MAVHWNPREHLQLSRYALKWLLIASPVAAVIGVAVAVFLWALDCVTHLRFDHPWLLYLLPVGGAAVGGLYHYFGKSVEGGNNLLVEQIHEPGGGVPARMAPLILITTVLTHLFGGSAGREGTAVQMGGSIASTAARLAGRWFTFSRADIRTLLMVGIAAGFGAVFGTPLTGAVFAIEVLAIGRMNYVSILPCLIAAIVGDQTCLRVAHHWNIHHTAYDLGVLGGTGAPLEAGFNLLLLGKIALMATACGLASVLFSELTHGVSSLFKRLIAWPMLRPVIGACIIIALAHGVGFDYLGLGVAADPHHPMQVSILSSFHPAGATPWSWWWKILFTAVTLGSGFKGGEVTPLFFIGATLGHSLAHILGAPVELFAALGFVAVFAGATNTPLACTIMGIELFGGGAGELLRGSFIVYLAVACFVSYLFSGHAGIYRAQRIGTRKGATEGAADGPSGTLGKI